MAAPIAGVVFLFLVALFIFRLSITKICRLILGFFKKRTPEEIVLQRDLESLTTEQERVDMKEEFAKHARLQRKINKISDELKSIRNSKLKMNLTLQGAFTVVLHIIHKVAYILVIWRLRSQPIITLREEWTWPIGTILAFPSGQPGTIGITLWVIMSSLVIRKIHHLIENVYQKR